MKKNNLNNDKIRYTDSEKYQKHFSLEDKIKIQKIISEHRNTEGDLTILLKDIGDMLQKDPSTISKEVKRNRTFKLRPVYNSYKPLNSLCENYNSCNIYSTEPHYKGCFLKACSKCINYCKNFKEKICDRLLKFPWVCNGCPKSNGCRLNKYFYYADVAHQKYLVKLSECREGINMSDDEFEILNHVVSDGIKNGQPIYHIVSSNDLSVCDRTIYNYIEKGYMSVINIDLRRKVKYKKRTTHLSCDEKNDSKKIKQGRTYEDYQNYIQNNPNASIVQMDTVLSAEGSKKVLLTFHFVKYHFQIAILLNSKKSIEINSAIDLLCDNIGVDNFKLLFEVILTDNGGEFSDPNGIEFHHETGEKRTNVFFCHPYSSWEKGHCEKNHEYIRYVLPKGTVFDFLTQEKVNLMMSHINSTIRPSLKSSPYDFMSLAYGKEILDSLQIKKIESTLINLTSTLIK